MYWVFYKIVKDWVVSGPYDKPQRALDSYASWVMIYGLSNVKLVQNVPKIDQMKGKLTITIEGMGSAVSSPDEVDGDYIEPDDSGLTMDFNEIDVQLLEEAISENPLCNWGFLARIARIKTLLVRVRIEDGSWYGYFVSVGSNNGMYSVLKPNDGGRNVRIYYDHITSIEFLGDDN